MRFAGSTDRETHPVVCCDNARAVSERFNFAARPCNIFEEPGAIVRNDDAPGEPAEELYKVGDAIVANRQSGFYILADQPFRSDKTALGDDQVEAFQQAMKPRFDPDQIRGVQDALSILFEQITRRLHTLAVYGRNRRDRVGAGVHRFRNCTNHRKPRRRFGSIDHGSFWHVIRGNAGVIGMEVRDEDVFRVMFEVLLLANIEKNEIVHEDSRVFRVPGRRAFDIPSCSEDRDVHCLCW